MLSREEIERRIYNHMDAIRNLIMQHSPEEIYFNATITSNGLIWFHNTWWKVPESQKINFIEGENDEI